MKPAGRKSGFFSCQRLFDNMPQPRHFAIIPAAGSGSRMGADRPKQYLALNGRPVLWHTLAALLQVAAIDQVVVVLAPDDQYWGEHEWDFPPERLQVLRVGGSSRAQSVANALQALTGSLLAADWVLVHDAARACIDPSLVVSLIEQLAGDPVGGLLAVPLADTLKRADAQGRVAQTLPREGLWQAQTPQMFRYGLLRQALNANLAVTDEAGAVEALGLQPRLIAGGIANLKLTYPQDLQLAAQILHSRSD